MKIPGLFAKLPSHFSSFSTHLNTVAVSYQTNGTVNFNWSANRTS